MITIILNYFKYSGGYPATTPPATPPTEGSQGEAACVRVSPFFSDFSGLGEAFIRVTPFFSDEKYFPEKLDFGKFVSGSVHSFLTGKFSQKIALKEAFLRVSSFFSRFSRKIGSGEGFVRVGCGGVKCAKSLSTIFRQYKYLSETPCRY